MPFQSSNKLATADSHLDTVASKNDFASYLVIIIPILLLLSYYCYAQEKWMTFA